MHGVSIINFTDPVTNKSGAGPTGPTGPAGTAGAAGPTGPTGPTGAGGSIPSNGNALSSTVTLGTSNTEILVTGLGGSTTNVIVQGVLTVTSPAADDVVTIRINQGATFPGAQLTSVTVTIPAANAFVVVPILFQGFLSAAGNLVFLGGSSNSGTAQALSFRGNVAIIGFN